MSDSLIPLLEALALQEAVSDVLLREDMVPWVREGGRLAPMQAAPVRRAELEALLRIAEPGSGIPVQKADELLNRRGGDLDFPLAWGRVRYRANLYRTNGRLWALALRKLRAAPPPMDSLGLPSHWRGLVERSKGLVLVTGSTGSGKSTTVASTLSHLNQTSSGHIITLEDPIEYRLESQGCLIDQRQIGADVKDFTSGLRAALREDPDVIFVGELRDRESVEIALQAANTGHLVLATLHTMNARQSVERITSFYPPETREWAQVVLSQVLQGVLCQTLVPHRDPTQPRLLAAELLLNTPDVAAAIREGRSNQIFASMDTGSTLGHVLLNASLLKLVRAGKVQVGDALRAAYDVSRLQKELSYA